jgi:hypothetical protein
MNRGIFITAALAIVGGAALNLALYSIAHAGGPGEIAAIAAIELNPLVWDWPWLVATFVTVLGAVIMALRPIALATKWTGDNRLLGWLETILAFVVKVFVPLTIRAKSMPLSMGTGKGGIGDQPYPPSPPPFSGGKSGGDAS